MYLEEMKQEYMSIISILPLAIKIWRIWIKSIQQSDER